MKKIIVTLIATILVFITTLLVVSKIIKKQVVKDADYYIENTLDDFCKEFDQYLMSVEKAAYGFLTGSFSKESEGAEGCIILEHSDKEFFEVNIKRQLASFLKANPYYHDVMFIIQVDDKHPVTQKSFYAPILAQGHDSIIDIAKIYDFSQSKNYMRCKRTLKSFWSIPSQKSNMAQKLVTYYIPLCKQRNGEMLGVFAIGIDISVIDKTIKNHLPYGAGNSEIVLSTNDGFIISSFPTNYKTAVSYDQLEDTFRVTGKVYEKKILKGRRIVEYNDTTYYQYVRHMKRAPWHVITACKTSAIYADAHRIQTIMYISSLTGMLLMLIACVIISYQVRRTHIAKMSAEKELTMAATVQAKILRKRDYSLKLKDKGLKLKDEGVKLNDESLTVNEDSNGRSASLNAFIRPAHEAGGDLYDYAEVDGKLIFCIGDVSGKGMSAALFMTQVVSLFRSAIRRSTDPASIITSINNVLADTNPDMTFCTLYVGVLDGVHLSFCNAGHNKPVLMPGDGREPCSFISQKPNIAVGLYANYPYATEQLSLTAGDALLLYTDGVTEAKNASRNMFGDQALLDTIAQRSSNNPSHVTSCIMDALNQFVKGAKQSDDITILSVSL